MDVTAIVEEYNRLSVDNQDVAIDYVLSYMCGDKYNALNRSYACLYVITEDHALDVIRKHLFQFKTSQNTSFQFSVAPKTSLFVERVGRVESQQAIFLPSCDKLPDWFLFQTFDGQLLRAHMYAEESNRKELHMSFYQFKGLLDQPPLL